MEKKLSHKDTLNKIVNIIIEHITKREQKLTNRELLKLCREYNLGNAEEIDPHLPHELAETAINLLILRNYGPKMLGMDNPLDAWRAILNSVTKRLPVQSWRSQSQIQWQQFSTPPTIGFLLIYLMNLKGGEAALEPSAGTGSLAVWSKSAGQETYVNEIVDRRRELLGILDFEPSSHNAEFIDDFLCPTVEIDCVIMNPPFSSNGGRTNKNSSKFGFRHVESALRRLRKGGKFGMILGNAGGIGCKTGNDFWRSVSEEVAITSILKLDGREFYKYGTSVDVNLIIGRKLCEPGSQTWAETRETIKAVVADSIGDAFELVHTLNLRLDK